MNETASETSGVKAADKDLRERIVDAQNQVDVDMTLTSPMCPVAGTLPGEVESKIRGVEGVSEVKVELVWDPPWSMEKMTEEARLQLGIDY